MARLRYSGLGGIAGSGPWGRDRGVVVRGRTGGVEIRRGSLADDGTAGVGIGIGIGIGRNSIGMRHRIGRDAVSVSVGFSCDSD